MEYYTFTEYLAACEGEDFNIIEPDWLKWAENFVAHITEMLQEGIHQGDCTKHCHTCNLCCIERMLEEYRNYRFNGFRNPFEEE